LEEEMLKVKLIEINQKVCTACRLCEMVCSLHHEQECSTVKSRIKILRDEEIGNHLVLVCIQCAETYCVESCPTQALRKDEETGVVLVDDELCNGCEICIDACPLDALSSDRERNTVFKCDLCGGDPECIKICPREVLILKEVVPDSPARKSFRDKTAKLLLQMRSVGKHGG
jgi:Fe-S-cluster-containing dehydrogenase component